ncbi:MAG: TIGR03618 family F420-dependent PPOX class oxidoreductase [Actinobacteria bacterium]|nr:TIGR03618 family F420-dependent PPOX class oxidoreductase [Actinomycetota bacterium]
MRGSGVAGLGLHGQDGRVSRRAEIAMGPDEVQEFLAQARTIILTTIGPDGVPDPVAMWFVVRDGDMWMRTYAKSQKVTNARRDPRVAVLVEQGERYAELRGVQVSGRLELSEDIDVICEIAAALLVKYEGLDPEHVPAAMEAYRPTATKQVAMRLVPERTVSWDHAKLVPGT